MRLRHILESPSKTLAACLAVFCFGILFGPLIPSGAWQILLVLMTFCVLFSFLVSKKERRFIFVLLAIFFFAIFRYTQANFSPTVPPLADASSSSVRVSGVVSAEVERRVNTQRIVLGEVQLGEEYRGGKLLLWAPLYPEVHFGDALTATCRIEQPERIEGFAYDRYLASQGILAVCVSPQYIDARPTERVSFSDALLTVKEFFVHRLRQIIPEPHASFVSGLLFGGSSALSRELKDDFSATGTSHILAASGFNISLFSASFLSWILKTRVGRRRGLILTAFLLFLYVIMAGATPAVVRAGIMGSLVIVSTWISRKAYLLNVLLLTASVMLLFNPLILLDDVGFQLSFAATVAILLFMKPLCHHLSFIPQSFALRESFAGSLAAIGMTLPILLWHFGKISLVAPFVNLLILPLVPYLMALACMGLLMSLPSLSLGTFFSLPAWSLSWMMLQIISLFGAIPFATVAPAHPLLLAVLTAGVIFIFFVRHRYASR
jgi:competence protein ComEC